jgi:hypothetical protein
LDATYLAIRLLASLGLATKVHLPRGNPAKLSERALSSPWMAGRPLRLPQPVQRAA